jgi:hypothetical protein
MNKISLIDILIIDEVSVELAEIEGEDDDKIR